MGVILDASVLIEAERGRLDVGPHLEARGDEPMFLSVITVSELLHGVERAQTEAHRVARAAFVESVLDSIPVLDIDTLTARAHARLWASLASRGEMIGPHDMWLAAACLAHGCAIATANVREFARVPGLVIEAWGVPV